MSVNIAMSYFCFLLLDGGSVKVYLSLLLSFSLQVPQEKGRCVTKICSSISESHFVFEAGNTSHDLRLNYHPFFIYLFCRDGFSTFRLPAGVRWRVSVDG